MLCLLGVSVIHKTIPGSQGVVTTTPQWAVGVDELRPNGYPGAVPSMKPKRWEQKKKHKLMGIYSLNRLVQHFSPKPISQSELGSILHCTSLLFRVSAVYFFIAIFLRAAMVYE